MPDSPLAHAALDPTLIKGIYDTCDQWCMYCPATSRCLAVRCDPGLLTGTSDPPGSAAETMLEDIIFQKCVAEAEGRQTREIDALLSDNPFAHPDFIVIDDPLERMGRGYEALSRAWLTSRPDYPFEAQRRACGPAPIEVVAWYHTLIPAKIFRALMSTAYAARGDEFRRQDAPISARVALVGIDRSLAALASLAAADDDPRHALLQAELRRLRRELEVRFPEARRIVRAGLDDVGATAAN